MQRARADGHPPRWPSTWETGPMPEERKSGTPRSGLAMEISDLVRAHGITRDQARRLLKIIGKNRTKLNHAASVLKARYSPRDRKMAVGVR